MTSNSKLTKAQKQFVKNFEAELSNNNGYFISNEKVTLLVIAEFPNSKMVEMSVSIMSDDEIKFRPTVGKYYAIKNYFVGGTVKVPRDADFDNIMHAMVSY